ncbi:MAG TPA: hypothetical protein VF585_06290 [Chthoniobacterales bacterium]
MESPRARDEAVAAIADGWSRSEPEKALAWLVKLPDGGGRGDALGRAVSNWANDHPEAVSAWLNKVPVGKSRDSMVGSFADALVSSEPLTAARWASSVSDEQQRRFTLENVLSQWSQKDKAAANQWLAGQTQFTESDRKSFRQRIDGSGQ